jgi:hypothetical protein
MYKYLSALFIGLFMAVPSYAFELSRDTSDPLFMQSRGGVLSKTSLDYFETGLRLGQSLSVGLADRFVIGGNVHYQRDFDRDENGFSSIDLGGAYRIGNADENKHRIIYDILGGLKFGGSKHVRTPDYADSTYYIGFRLGRQYEGVTFAGTIKSSWIFDDKRGMAFIDLIPEMYVRVAEAWRFGVNMAFRKATNPHYDEESVGAKLVREYGRTQYVGHIDYAFESEDISAGVSVNILF